MLISTRYDCSCGLRWLLSTAGALVAVAAASAQAQIVGPLQRITDLSIFNSCTADNPAAQPGTVYPNTEIEPNLAINPANPNNILIGVQQDRWSNGGARGLRGEFTLDGFATFNASSTPGVTKCQGGVFNRASDPWVSFSPNGTAYFSSLVVDELADPNLFGRNGQMVSRSIDGGKTWGPPITLIDTPAKPATKPQSLNDKNSVTADPNNNSLVYVVWDQLTIFPGAVLTGDPEAPVVTPAAAVGAPAAAAGAPAAVGARAHDGMSITRELRKQARANPASANAATKFPPFVTGPTLMSRTTNGGKSWEKPRVIFDPGANNQTIGNQIIVLPGGDLADYFTFQNDLTGADQIGFVRSFNHGASWSAATFPVDMVNTEALTPNLQQPIRSADIIFSIATDNAHQLIYLAWEDTRFSGVNEVAWTFSPDGGNSWATPVRINQTPRTPTNTLFQQALIPSVTAAADGTVVVTYYDFRRDVPGATTDAADYFAVFCNPLTSADACQSTADWSTEVRLTDDSFDFDNAPDAGGHFLGDYMGLKATGETVWPVFGQAVAANLTDLFTRKITVRMIAPLASNIPTNPTIAATGATVP